MDPRELLNQGYTFSQGRIVTDGVEVSLFQLSKAEIINLQFDRLLKKLKEVESGPTHGFSSIGLTIDGYNDTVEELYEIPHIRRFFYRLIKKVPHFLYYMNPVTRMPHQIIGSLSDFHQFRKTENLLTPLEVLKRDGNLDEVGEHEVLFLLPSDIGYKMIDAIEEHIAKIDFKDTTKEIPVILQMIEYSIPEKDRRIGWQFRYKKNKK